MPQVFQNLPKPGNWHPLNSVYGEDLVRRVLDSRRGTLMVMLWDNVEKGEEARRSLIRYIESELGVG